MFKKYAKNLLDKEVRSQEALPPSPQTFSSMLEVPTFEERMEEQPEDFSNEDPEMTIGEKVTVKGTLSFEHLIRIDGTFEGELFSQGKLIVGPTGVVKAHINLKEAFISGKVEGDITVREKLILRGRAEITGNISAASITVDEGVSIVGQVMVATTLPTPPDEPFSF